MRLAEPPGVRSCRDGGEWTWCRASGGRPHVLLEVEELKKRIKTDVERNAMVAELADRMRLAEQGDLKYDEGEGGDVVQMEVAKRVLEVRLPDRHDEDGERHHVRMYFTEPAHVDRQLLALKLAWKHPGEIGLEEQNQHAIEASNRADNHFLRPA